MPARLNGGNCITEDFWFIVVDEGNQDETEITDAPNSVREDDQRHPPSPHFPSYTPDISQLGYGGMEKLGYGGMEIRDFGGVIGSGSEFRPPNSS